MAQVLSMHQLPPQRGYEVLGFTDCGVEKESEGWETDTNFSIHEGKLV